mgnify:CR=1 FL=1
MDDMITAEANAGVGAAAGCDLLIWQTEGQKIAASFHSTAPTEAGVRLVEG